MNTRNASQLAALVAILSALTTSACSDEPTESPAGAGAGGGAANGKPPSSAGQGSDPFRACSRAILEPDWREDAPLVGPGVDPASGELEPGSYRIATTYLPVKPEKAAAVLELSGPIIQTLQSSRGLVAVATGQSASCAAFRTLTVWESEEDMLAFVLSPAHVRAMAETSAISRGSTATISWQGSAADGSWERAVERLLGAQDTEL
ncbi:MAG TPA: antibiotic biosynthesis monooxygenase [Polyangiaceae bacterium]|nr:antibiotic biosynthesis monooxygenase [Polyangiaceae bacterium]